MMEETDNLQNVENMENPVLPNPETVADETTEKNEPVAETTEPVTEKTTDAAETPVCPENAETTENQENH